VERRVGRVGAGVARLINERARSGSWFEGGALEMSVEKDESAKAGRFR
jgi:hypothetical protein